MARAQADGSQAALTLRGILLDGNGCLNDPETDGSLGGVGWVVWLWRPDIKTA